MESNDVLGLLLGFLSDVATVLPPLAEGIANFTKTVTDVVDELVAYFDDEANKRHIAETADEARTLCQELLHAIIYSDAYMEKVDTFAWHARHKRRQNKVVEALEQEIPQLQPMMEYISQLRHSLSQAEDSHEIFENSGFGGILEKLNKVLGDNQENLTKEEQQKTKIQITGGAVAGGAMAVAGASAAAVAAIPTAGIASAIILGIAAGSVGIGTTVYTYKLSKEYDKVIAGIKALTMLVKKITGIARSIQLIIVDVRLRLGNISSSIDQVNPDSGSLSSMMANLEMLFEKLNKVGQTCHDCHQKLSEKKQSLETFIDKLLNI